MSLTRRGFTQQTLGSLLTYSLLETLGRSGALGADVKPLVGAWLTDVNNLARELKDRKLKQLDWQKKVEELLVKVDLPALLKAVDFDQLAANVNFAPRGELSLKANFPKVEGLPTNLVFGRQIFALKKDRSVVPHGHNNMATAFLILQGELRGRHYDRVKDEPQHMLIKSTIDRKFTAGEVSTVSDFKDNVHWFQASSERAFIFNLHVLDVNPGGKLPTGRVYIDPQGEKLAGGMVRARVINHKEANELYG